MPRIEESIEIQAAPIDVFRFCHDIVSRPEWDEQVTYIELLTGKLIRSGTLMRVDSKGPSGEVFSWEGEYVSYQPPLSSRVRVLDAASASPFDRGSEVSWEFGSVGDKTRLTWVWDYHHRGIIARILDFLGGRASTRRAIKRSLANAKEMLESGKRVIA
jgi:uncharacterized protein YndB with AHSA1/START domain